MTKPSGMSKRPIPRKSRARLSTSGPRPPGSDPRSDAGRAGAARRAPGRARDAEDGEREQRGERRAASAAGFRSSGRGPRAGRDRGAEEVGRAGPEHAAGRHRVAPRAPALRPLDRLGPLRLQVRARRPVEERALELAPAPSKAIQGNARRAAAGSLGIVMTSGRSSTCGPRVSSQPTPASAELPRYSASVNLFACEPAAGYTTGCVPSTSSSLSSPQSARSAPSCEL